MQAEAEGRLDVARTLFAEAWSSQTNDVEACIAAHYLARHQADPQATLHWNEEAVRRADAANDPLVQSFYPSLYLNLGWSHEQIGDWCAARHWYTLAEQSATSLPIDVYAETVRSGVAAGLQRLAATLSDGQVGLL